MKYNELIYDIREKLRQTVDDTNIDDREIIFNINVFRSLFYRNQYNQRNRIIDEDVKQTLVVSMSEYDITRCGSSECTILRSDDPLPTTVELHHKNAVFNVRPVDIGSKSFSLTSWNKFPYVGTGKYSGKEIFASIDSEGYLYLKSKNNLDKFINKVSVTVILENPLDIENFLDCEEDEDCFDLQNFEYPLKGYAYSYIKQQVLQDLVQKLKTPEDEINDAESN